MPEERFNRMGAPKSKDRLRYNHVNNTVYEGRYAVKRSIGGRAMQREGDGLRGAHSDTLGLLFFLLPHAANRGGTNVPAARPLSRSRLAPTTTSGLAAPCASLLLLHHIQLGSNSAEVLTFASKHLLKLICQLLKVGLRFSKQFELALLFTPGNSNPSKERSANSI
eukprot:COSAG02_NODE_475_length_21552_cov_4.236470_22_plen_166_part_00